MTIDALLPLLQAAWAMLLTLLMNPDALMGLAAFVLMAVYGEWDLNKRAADLIPKAEQQLALIGIEKRDWVVNQLYALIPLPVRMFLPRALVNALVQALFDRAFASDLDHSAKMTEDAAGK